MSASTIRLSDGRQIPRIGYGLGGIKPEATTELVASAISAGYRLFDTAVIYNNERALGEAIARTRVPRSQLFITTKCWPDRFGADEVTASFNESLSRLGLDFVDLYLLHWPAPDSDLYVDSWNALIELREQGRVKSIGVSNFYPGQIERLAGETGVMPVVNQIELHPYFQRVAERDFHLNNAITTECWSPLGRRQCFEDPVVLSVAKKHGCTAAQVILRFLLDQNLVVIPRSRDPQRLAANFDVHEIVLAPEDRQHLTALDKGLDGKLNPDPDFSP